MRICLFALLLCIGYTSFAQTKPYTQEWAITSQNDAYLAQLKDGYYTNGLFFRWNKLLPNHLHKTIAQFEVGQMQFTPQGRRFYRLYGIDRPYCGYLYLKYGRSYFVSHQSMLQWSAQLGTTGRNSFGEQVMDAYHSLFGFQNFKGWEYQIGNELGINGHIAFATTAWQPYAYLKIVPLVEANLGNTFTNVKAGAYVSVGLFNSNHQSALLNAGIDATTQPNHELFAYWFPQYILQGYNATVQGGLLTQYPQAVTAAINPIVYQQTWGLVYAKNRWTLKLEIVYQTQECTTQTLPQRYGSIGIGKKLW